MKKIKNQSESSALFGQKLTYRKQKRQVLLINKPAYSLEGPTADQEAVQRKFREAALYATQQMTDPESKKQYEKRITEKLKSARTVAMADYLNPPRVIEINTSNYQGIVGDTIVVIADDDFMVTGVRVAIFDGSNNLLEKGDAVSQTKLNHWKYVATVANPSVAGTRILATATDKPENIGQLEKTL